MDSLTEKRFLFLQNLTDVKVIFFCSEKNSFEIAILNRFLKHKLAESDIYCIRTQEDFKKVQSDLQGLDSKNLFLAGIFDNYISVDFLKYPEFRHKIIALIGEIEQLVFFNENFPKDLQSKSEPFLYYGLEDLIAFSAGSDSHLDNLLRCAVNSSIGNFSGEVEKKIHAIIQFNGVELAHMCCIFSLEASAGFSFSKKINDYVDNCFRFEENMLLILSGKTQAAPQITRVVVDNICLVDFDLLHSNLLQDYQFAILIYGVVDGDECCPAVISKDRSLEIPFKENGIKIMGSFKHRIFFDPKDEDKIIQFLSRWIGENQNI